MDGCPRVGNIKEQCINFHFSSIVGKTFRDNVSPGGADLLDLEVFKKLLGDFRPLLIELKGVEMPFLANGLRNSTRQ